jgi:hypothetical protein
MEVVKNDEANEPTITHQSEMKVMVVGSDNAISESTMEALVKTMQDLGEPTAFFQMQPDEVKAYMAKKESDASQVSMDDFLKDEKNIKRAEALAKTLDNIVSSNGNWMGFDKISSKFDE